MKKTGERRLAAFRRRLAARRASWAIEIPARRRITLELTEAQQEMLRRATKHVVPSVTLVLSSNTLEPNGHALACLELGSARRARAKRRRAR
ncbi:MAG TPA: hypothetical protein VHF87_00600 [Methylomirabilota bacterium]|nr:hypothetical protein [Methylomirabilota bacterium]